MALKMKKISLYELNHLQPLLVDTEIVVIIAWSDGRKTKHSYCLGKNRIRVSSNGSFKVKEIAVPINAYEEAKKHSQEEEIYETNYEKEDLGYFIGRNGKRDVAETY